MGKGKLVNPTDIKTNGGTKGRRTCRFKLCSGDSRFVRTSGYIVLVIRSEAGGMVQKKCG